MITKEPLEQGLGDEDQPHAQEPTRLMVLGRGLRTRPWIVVIILIVIAAIVWFLISRSHASAGAPHYQTAKAAIGDISATVEETGTVNPVDVVNVGTQVSGTVSTLNVDYNSPVKAGEVLATLDPTSFEASVAQANGSLSAARSSAAAAASTAAQQAAGVQAALDNAASAQASLAKAQAQVVLTNATVSRDKQLIAQGYVPQSQLDTDVASARANEADVVAAQAAVKAAKAQVAVAQAQQTTSSYQSQGANAQISSAAANLQQAQYDLSRAVITSPIDGVVVARDIAVGQTVAASFQTPTLFEIASTLKDMQVDTSVSEADVGQLRTGQAAQISVPAYPNVVFKGSVQQVRINPTTVSNVVTYDAVVMVHDETQRLKPGMTADVTFDTQSAKNVLIVPAAALLYHPTTPQQSTSSGGGGFFGSGPTATPPPIAGAPGSHVDIYVLRAGKPVRVPIVIGLSDGRNYEVTSGELQSGDAVIVGQSLAHTFTTSNPMGGGFGR